MKCRLNNATILVFLIGFAFLYFRQVLIIFIDRGVSRRNFFSLAELSFSRFVFQLLKVFLILKLPLISEIEVLIQHLFTEELALLSKHVVKVQQVRHTIGYHALGVTD